ncbi:hypothetical protein Pmani_010154 [Petrolisthes manimaculis]|uniref:Uncharacterized protein n=1 Tax=Petrolisthes manimaculis TaxID=1843537 RepID=A0AAE1Q502_9EUCA|nr:hypothetical protein Pmani_010154 [Petrolisthes manimaculis]
MADGMLSLSWNNHSTTFCHTLTALRAKEKYTDVTLACEGKFYQVHKLVLSTCSEYFENMFEETPCKHPVIVLSEIHREELEALLSYMYAGYVNVAENKLARLIKVAELLEIKGLAVPDEPPNGSKKNGSSSNQRTICSHSSPLVRNKKVHSPVSEGNYSPNKSLSSSNDRNSPSPKRMRRDSGVATSENTDPPTHTQAASTGSVKQTEVDTRQDDQQSSWSEHQQDRRDNLEPDTPSTPQEPITDKVQVTLDETLVKEELVEETQDHSVDDTLLETSGGDQSTATTLLIPKYDPMPQEQQEVCVQPPSLHEAVIEALAGPSGMQGWPGGGDIARRLALGENFVGDGNQDLNNPSLNQSPAVQSHAVVRVAQGGHRMDTQRLPEPPQLHLSTTHIREEPNISCSLAQFQMSDSGPDARNLMKCSHNGNKPYSCPFCSFRASHQMGDNNSVAATSGMMIPMDIAATTTFQCHHCSYTTARKYDLNRHMRTHTGEKPWSCPHCSRQFALKHNLKSHLRIHNREYVLYS